VTFASGHELSMLVLQLSRVARVLEIVLLTQVGAEALPPIAPNKMLAGELKSFFLPFFDAFCDANVTALPACLKTFLAWFPNTPPRLAKSVTHVSSWTRTFAVF